MNVKLANILLTGLLATAMTSLGAEVVLVDDNFSSSTIHQDTRFSAADIDTGRWVKRDSSWSITNGSLINLGSTEGTDDRGAHRLDSVSTLELNTLITVSFDYSVGEGSTLYFYSALFTGSPVLTSGIGTGSGPRLSQQNGGTYMTDFTSDTTFGYFDGPEYNLHNGATPGNATGSAVASFAGGTSGTFSQTYDISGYGGGGFSITNVTHVLNIFTLDTTATAGAVTISNFYMTASAPEPPVENDILQAGYDSVSQQITIQWQSEPTASYDIEAAPEISASVSFTSLVQNIVATSATTSVEIPVPGDPQMFYRVYRP